MYEYKVVEFEYPKDMEAGINKMASEGWRVVSTAMWHNFKVTMVVTFEREKQ